MPKKTAAKATNNSCVKLLADLRAVLGKAAADTALGPIVDDFIYYIDHYDLITGRSHQRHEAWGLCPAVLELLAFNLPVMIASSGAIPERCVRAAVRKAGKPLSPAARARAARALWKEELKALLKAVNEYRLYQDYALVDHGQRKILPLKELRRRRAKAWRAWTAQYRKIGADLWL